MMASLFLELLGPIVVIVIVVIVLVVVVFCCCARLDNIGLRKFTTASLFLELLGPVSFLMVIIIQLHYFHADFLRISSLDRFKK